MFEPIEMAPPDPIIGLTEAFRSDPSPAKINLGVGVYKAEDGTTPLLECVREAERQLCAGASTKDYLPIDGSPAYGALVRQMLFGPGHELAGNGLAVTLHTPGGTGALRVAADYLHAVHPSAAVWLSEPTWPNHPAVFAAAGVRTRTYPYFDAGANCLDFDRMLAALQTVPAGDVVLLHACCHNPTGIDPLLAQWRQIADVLGERGVLPLIDFAYQGFGAGLAEDAVGLRELCRPGCELLVCSSFSKNFGLYNERVGGLTAVAGGDRQAAAVLSQLKRCVRANYSNPPCHGAAIVTRILSDPELRQCWEQELAAMRARVNGMRRLFVDTLVDLGVTADFSFIARQRGMFSFSGLNKQQVQALRERYAIYIVGSGRVNVAGMTESNMRPLCEAIASVL